MSKFEVILPLPGYSLDRDNSVHLFNNDTGERATIDLHGCSLQGLVFNYDGVLRNVVFSHADFVDFANERRRGDFTLEDRPSPLENAAEVNRLMHLKPTFAGGAVIDIANRVFEGKVAVVNPADHRIIRVYELGINHEDSNSHLHGEAPNHEFPVMMHTQSDSGASVTFHIPIGIGTNYPSGAIAVINYILTDKIFKEEGLISNHFGHLIPVAFGRHGSYLIQGGDLKDHSLKLPAIAVLKTTKQLNPTGELGKPAFNIHRYEPVYGYNLDRTLLLDPYQPKVIKLLNRFNRCGLKIEIEDETTKLVTVWNNYNFGQMHLAIEPLLGSHGASLSLPNSMDPASIEDCLKQLVIKPGESVKYSRVYTPFIENHFTS